MKTPRDWYLHAGLIAAYMPGVGNPLDLPLDDFERFYDVLPIVAGHVQGNGVDDRDWVERQASLIGGFS